MHREGKILERQGGLGGIEGKKNGTARRSISPFQSGTKNIHQGGAIKNDERNK